MGITTIKAIEGNTITSEGVRCISEVFKENKTLKSLNLGNFTLIL